MSTKVNLNVVIPFGVAKMIYPWGAKLILDYIEATCNFCMCNWWDLSADVGLRCIQNNQSSFMQELLFTLKAESRSIFYQMGLDPYPQLFGILSYFGSNYLNVIQRQKLVRKFSLTCKKTKKQRMEALDYLKNTFEVFLKEEVAKRIDKKSFAKNIFAFSVFDHTVFNCLYIAKIIKEYDSTAIVIFGGDYFDFNSARKIMCIHSLVDGVIIGNGEEVLRQTIEFLRVNNQMSNLTIPGLINGSNIDSSTVLSVISEINKPIDHLLQTRFAKCSNFTQTSHKKIPSQLHTEFYAKYVAIKKDNGVLHILTQRGCQWGRCTFCTIFSRKMKEKLIPLEGVLPDVKKFIQGYKKRELFISLDADENSLQQINPILQEIVQTKAKQLKIYISLWLMVYEFYKNPNQFIKTLYLAKKNNVFFTVILNVESLNPVTLKNMRKGHTPLQAIEALKIIQNTGHNTVTNYFSCFPLESSKDILQELIFLQKIPHLIGAAYQQTYIFPYLSNNRDDISVNQNKFKISISQIKEDCWLNEAFNIALPFSTWSFKSKRLIKFSSWRDGLAASLYNEIESLRFLGMLSKNSILLRLYEIIILKGKYFLLKTIWCFLQIIMLDLSYLKRDNFFILHRKMSSEAYSKGAKSKLVINRYFLKLLTIFRRKRMVDLYLNRKRELIKVYSRSKTIRILKIYPLCRDEYVLLRYLYRRKSVRQIYAQFGNQIPIEKINLLLKRHVKLGVLIEENNCYLSVCVIKNGIE